MDFSNTVNVENPGRLHLPWPVPISPRVIHGNFHLLYLSLPCNNTGNNGIHHSWFAGSFPAGPMWQTGNLK